MCIGPLSTLMTNFATRISRINCSSDVWLVSSTQFSATSHIDLAICFSDDDDARRGEGAADFLDDAVG